METTDKPLNITRFKAIFLQMLSTNMDGEADSARLRLLEILARHKLDIFWVANHLDGGGGVSQHDVDAAYARGLAAGAAKAGTGNRPPHPGEMNQAFNRGRAAGWDDGYRKGFEEASDIASRRQTRPMKLDFTNPVHVGEDLRGSSEATTQEWATWLLDRRREHLVKHDKFDEIDFCERIARYSGAISDRQYASLLIILQRMFAKKLLLP